MKKYGAYGLVEVKGESNAVIVVDRMLKDCRSRVCDTGHKVRRTCT